jgi:hypothetical protein
MTKFIRDKRIITQTILDELPFQKDDGELEKSLKRWWKNIREDGGLRLTNDGDNAFRLAGLEYWDYQVTQNEMNKVFSLSGALELDHYLPCPYYLHYNKIEKTISLRLYDSRVAMMIQLHGSVIEYLNSIKIKLNIDER